jgi:hypothetical protein
MYFYVLLEGNDGTLETSTNLPPILAHRHNSCGKYIYHFL